MKKIIRFLFAPIGGALGYWAWKLLVMLLGTGNITLFGWADIVIEIALISAMTLIGYFVGGPAADAIHKGMTRLTKNAKEMPAKDLLLAVVGLLVGFVAAFLISSIFRGISNEILVVGINALIYVVCGTLGVRIALLRRNDVELPGKTSSAQGGTLLDTSILIDGRACDLLKSGFLPSPVILPKFVLEEVTRMADAEDTKKRTRGRLGLDEAKKMQEQGAVLSDEDYKELSSREEKLIRLAQEKNAAILTTDYSLNMTASLQNVRVLNVNELVNALKPTLVTGDSLTIEISKPGKDRTQGVGYLDDGTMVVVENGAEYLDRQIDVTVTSMLQTNAGKIIFAKKKGE